MTTQERKYFILIFIIFIAACIETDIYLPAFPDMMRFFAVSEETIQSLLTWNFLGICLAGPFYGPISDAMGRKKPLIAALGLFLLGSIMTLAAQGFEYMLIGRLLQGLGSGGCFTLGTAIFFDAFQEQRATQALNRMNTVVPLVMAAAPMLGGWLNCSYGFRSNFVAITFFVLLSFIACLLFFKETLTLENRKPLHAGKILGDFKRACCSLPFWQLTSVVCFVFAAYIVFLSGTSVLFVLEFGVSKQLFPFYQAALLAAWVIASLLSSRAIDRWGTFQVKVIGTTLITTGGIGVLLGMLFAPQNPLLFTCAMMFFAFGANWTQGIYFPESMAILPDIKGITASLLTSARLLISAACVGVTSYFYNATIYPIAIAIIGIVCAILPVIILYERRYGGALQESEVAGQISPH